METEIRVQYIDWDGLRLPVLFFPPPADDDTAAELSAR